MLSNAEFQVKSELYKDDLSLAKNILCYANEHQPLFQYRVNMSTNIGDCTLPLTFQFIQYCPTGTKGWMLDFLVQGRVTSVREVSEFPGLPQ
ncbi:MAG TPA: hypothetical protein VJA21_32205 [Verrucomicrobiae bacterium]